MNARSLLSEAKRRLPLPQLMSQCGHAEHAKKSARCPWHDDSSASFSIYQRADGLWGWKCHAGCGGGDEVDYLAKFHGLANGDACREFITLAGVENPPTTFTPPPRSKPEQPVPPFDWSPCRATFTPEQQAKLAAWRTYSPEFVAWLHQRGLIGLFDGDHIAFPVHDAAGHVIAAHYRRKEDGSWRFHPAGMRTAPLIVGDLATATTVLAFESQWDFCAIADRLQWHVDLPANTAAVITRGAGNGRLLTGLCTPAATVFAFPQNDAARPDGKPTPAAKWLAEIAAACGGSCRAVVTPPPHKDANDWTRAGATAEELLAAIAAATLVEMPPPPRAISNSLPALPEEDEPEATPFPVDCLPPIMAGIVAAVSRCERVPLALPGVCALGIVSAALGAGLEVVSGANKVARGNLFLLASAVSGSGKSETFRLIAAPLVEHQQRQLEIWKTTTSPQLQSEIRVLDKEIGTLEKKAAKSSDPTERDRLVGELAYKLARKDDLTRKAALPCTIAQDVTTERLAVLLRDNREVIFSASADARKLVDNLMGRYNPGKTTDESLYLSGFTGDLVRVDRQGRDPVVLHRPCLSLCWFIQPDLLATMLGEDSLSASGFLPRLLLCHTHATPQRIEGEPHTITDQTRGEWAKLVTDLFATFHDAETPRRIMPTPEVTALLIAFHNFFVDRLAADLADVAIFAARYAEQAWRLAVVLHGALHGTAAAGEPLALETAQNAIRLAEWFSTTQLDVLAKGRRAAAAKVEDAVVELLDSIHERKGHDFVTARDLHRARIVTTAAAARALLERMEREGLLVGEDTRPPHGGKTTRIFRTVGGKNPVPG